MDLNQVDLSQLGGAPAPGAMPDVDPVVAAAADPAAAQMGLQDAFMNKFGPYLNGNQRLGASLFEQLEANGINTAEMTLHAMNQFLESVRMEGMQVTADIEAGQKALAAYMQKIDKIGDAVDAATSGVADPTAEQQPEPIPMPADPMAGDPGAMPPPPPDMGAAPPPPPEQPPMQVSDVNLKENKHVVSDERMKALRSKVANARKAKSTAWKPSAEMLAGVKGAM